MILCTVTFCTVACCTAASHSRLCRRMLCAINTNLDTVADAVDATDIAELLPTCS